LERQEAEKSHLSKKTLLSKTASNRIAIFNRKDYDIVYEQQKLTNNVFCSKKTFLITKFGETKTPV
jgi:hypothetical protein